MKFSFYVCVFAFGVVFGDDIYKTHEDVKLRGIIFNISVLHVRRNVFFRLWNHEHKNKFLPLGHEYIKESLKNKNLDVKFLIHGWKSSADEHWYKKIVDEYLKLRNLNIIGVDWRMGASFMYPFAVGMTIDIGQVLARFIREMHNTEGVPLKNIHLIGHSLGAHIAGYAAEFLELSGLPKLGRITGLDPAGPFFHHLPSDERLSACDAEFVDVIHSDKDAFGLDERMGHVDFYPNGGNGPQPGCWLHLRASPPPKKSWFGDASVASAVGCSHRRAYEYFIESINSTRFVATRCRGIVALDDGSCANHEKLVMGAQVPIDAEGTYYLHTNARPPFAL